MHRIAIQEFENDLAQCHTLATSWDLLTSQMKKRFGYKYVMYIATALPKNLDQIAAESHILSNFPRSFSEPYEQGNYLDLAADLPYLLAEPMRPLPWFTQESKIRQESTHPELERFFDEQGVMNGYSVVVENKNEIMAGFGISAGSDARLNAQELFEQFNFEHGVLYLRAFHEHVLHHGQMRELLGLEPKHVELLRLKLYGHVHEEIAERLEVSKKTITKLSAEINERFKTQAHMPCQSVLKALFLGILQSRPRL